MADRDMFATTDLLAPLAERGVRLSSSQVYRLVVERPERLSLKILMALLDILDCSMEELIEPPCRPATSGEEGGRRRGRCRGLRPSGPVSWCPTAVTTAGLPDRAVSDPIGPIVDLVSAVEQQLSPLSR